MSSVLMDPMAREVANGPVRSLALETAYLDVDVWDKDSKTYTTSGQVLSKYFIDESDSSLHAACTYTDLKKDGGNDFPRVWYGSTSENKIYEVKGISSDDLKSNETSAVDVELFAYAMAPSGMEVVTSSDGELSGWLLGGGNPFGQNTDPETGESFTNEGSVAFLPHQDEIVKSAPMLFPPASISTSGTTINTMACHESGLCIFTEHRFYIGAPFGPQDCLFWCVPVDPFYPEVCASSGIMTYPDGKEICSTRMEAGSHYGGGPHSLAMGRTSESDPGIFDIVLIFTGGASFTEGVSHMEKMTVQYRAGEAPITLSMPDFGAQLWNDTVELPLDVGLDHAWVSSDKRYVWISTFREGNNGFHMMDLDTGDLILSLHGVEGIKPGQYTYPAGAGGSGRVGEDNSFVFITASAGSSGIGNNQGVNILVNTAFLPGFSDRCPEEDLSMCVSKCPTSPEAYQLSCIEECALRC